MHIEYTNVKTGNLEKQDIIKCFYYTTYSFNQVCKARQGSICVGIQIPHKSIQESTDFWNNIHPGYENNNSDNPIAHLCTESYRIPFYVLDGNGYDPQYDSSCIFAHVSPYLFANEDPPERIVGKEHLGCFPMELKSEKQWTVLENGI